MFIRSLCFFLFKKTEDNVYLPRMHLTSWIENHLPVRSIQRRLNDEDVLWSQLVMSIRQSKIRGYVNMPNITVTQLAFLLGFSSIDEFSNAFKIWYGVFPEEYKQNMMEQKNIVC